MDWINNHQIRRYAVWGFLGGLCFVIAGTWMEIALEKLPREFYSIFIVQRLSPLLWVIDTAPLVLGFVGGMIGSQKSLLATVSQAKHEWETVFDSVSDPTFVTDKEGRILRCNHAVIDRLNTYYANVVGKLLTEVLASGSYEELERFQNMDKEFSWLGRLYEPSISLVKGAGLANNNIIILHDVTAHKQAEGALRESESRLRGLFAAMSDIVIVYDKNGKYVSIAPTHPDLLIKPPEELIGMTLHDVFPKQEADGLRDVIQTVLKNRSTKQIEYSLPISGQTMWFAGTVSPMQDDAVVWVARDITQRKQADEKLRQLSQAVEQSASTIVITDTDGSIVYANPKFTDTTGYTLDEAIGKNPRILKSGYTSSEEYKHLWDTITSGGEWHGELHNKKKNGDLYWESATISPILNEAGKVTHFLAVKEDITRRKKIEEKLVVERNLLNTLIDNLPDYIFVKDINSRLMMDNIAHRRLLGTTVLEEVVGKTDFDFFPRELATQYIVDEQRIIQSGESMINREEPVVDPDGNQRWLLTTKVPLRDHQGMITGIVGINRDITERKLAEAELLREKKYLEALNMESPVAIVVMDKDEKVVSINPAFEKLYGYTSSEAVGVLLDTLITTEETRTEAARFSQEIMQGAIHGIVRRRRKDGTLVDVELSGVPIIVSGERLGGLAIYHDITELARSRREAEESNRAKSEFLANMSHEIRTPMNGVMGMLELALDTQLTHDQRDYLQTSLHSAEALLSLLNDILDFSKIESGKLNLDAINFSLRNAVEDVAYTLAKRAHEKGLEIACLIDPDITSSLRGDPGRLRQILVNLVGNAIKFTHQGEIIIRAETLEQTEHHATVHFSVQDTGIGIPYERQAAVFERFTQADGSTTRTYGGTGLGLTISKQLVEIMGGKIGLQSTPGIGTTFWFDIRFEKQPLEKRDTAPLTLGPVNLTHARVLVVDDNQTNRMVLTKNVEALGSRVDAVSSGAKALESLRNAHRVGDPYHIVLLDMQMPGMDGEQTARAIKSDPSVKDVKILILTSMGQRGDAVRLEALGCSGYLLKPVKQQMLFDAVIAVLGRKDDRPPSIITRHVLAEQRKNDLRILLAEDNLINQKLAVVLLQKAGYSVDAVETGIQALERVKADHYNVILMDVQMPDMDGFEATHQIRLWEQGNGQHIPIIAMTAHAMAGDRERCIDAGMDDYVTKPLEPRVLFSAIDRWTQKTDPEKIAQTEKKQDDPAAAQHDFSPDFRGTWFGDDTSPVTFETSETFDQTHEKSAPVSQADSSPDKLPADLEAALYRFDGDRTFMMEMCREFKDHLPDRVEELRTALQAGELEKLGRTAHNLKGLCMNFNAGVLAGLAARLEACGKEKNMADAPALVGQITIEITRLQEYLSQQLS
ncbi:MAG: PAS domain S-box protein [Chloroflexi bacterium]|nr:PAS domain S-box protein [Chloroflexota bacterium]